MTYFYTEKKKTHKPCHNSKKNRNTCGKFTVLSLFLYLEIAVKQEKRRQIDRAKGRESERESEGRIRHNHITVGCYDALRNVLLVFFVEQCVISMAT